MVLDLRDIVAEEGGRKPFKFDLDLSEFTFDGISEFKAPVCVTGVVENRAGLITLTADLEADVMCVCARCLKEFPKHLSIKTDCFLADEIQNEDNVDIFVMDHGCADLDEIASTAFILNMDQRILCKEDCKGLCSKCGNNLNDGPCGCKDEGDPRLAVLRQLLENED